LHKSRDRSGAISTAYATYRMESSAS
jgi:hypothetical protein